MSRLNSFFLPPDEWPETAGAVVILKGAEARHMGTVLRTEPGATVRLFDGMGRMGMFTVTSLNKREATLTLESQETLSPPKTGLTLAIGWGKSKRRNYLFEKVVELQGVGVSFWQAARSQGLTPKVPKDSWEEKCVQAAKQCGSVWLPEISTFPNGIDAVIQAAGDYDHCFFAWESGEATLPLQPAMLSGRSLIVIGPEGGFDDSEAKRILEAGFKPVTLGPNILRWETAATYCLSLAMCGMQNES